MVEGEEAWTLGVTAARQPPIPAPASHGDGKPRYAYAYLRDPAEISRRSFALIREEADLARFPQALRPLALRLAHAAGDCAILDDLAWSQGRRYGRAARARRRRADARRFGDGRGRHHPRPAAGEQRGGVHLARSARRQTLAVAQRTTRSAAAVELWRRISGGCRGRDRQCADGAVSPPRAARRGRRRTGADPRFSGRLCRRRRSQGGACRFRPRPRLHHPPRPARRQRPRRRGGQRARRRQDEARGSASSGSARTGSPDLPPAARTLVDTAEILVGGARHLAMVPESVAESGAERLVWDRPLAARSRRSRPGADSG